MVTQIAFLSASELVDAYGGKTVSPVEVTKTVLARAMRRSVRARCRLVGLEQLLFIERWWRYRGKTLLTQIAFLSDERKRKRRDQNEPHDTPVTTFKAKRLV